MSDRPLPPPLPPPLVPFTTAKDDPTAPGIGMPPEMVALRRENARLRRERDEALALVDAAERSSLPPRTRRQRAVGFSLGLGKYAALLGLLPALGVALAQVWPEYEGTIQAVTNLARGWLGQ